MNTIHNFRKSLSKKTKNFFRNNRNFIFIDHLISSFYCSAVKSNYKAVWNSFNESVKKPSIRSPYMTW